LLCWLPIRIIGASFSLGSLEQVMFGSLITYLDDKTFADNFCVHHKSLVQNIVLFRNYVKREPHKFLIFLIFHLLEVKNESL